MVRNSRIIECARRYVQRMYLVADIDQHAGNKPERRPDLQDFLTIYGPQQMNLCPLMYYSFTGVVVKPIPFCEWIFIRPVMPKAGVHTRHGSPLSQGRR